MVVLSAPGWTLTDDSGSGQTGTPLDAAWAASLKADIDLLCHSSSNPTLTPANIIDEVVTARGTKSSLDARLDVSLNNDGTLIVGTTVPTFASLGNGLGATNLLCNDDTLLWSAGDTAMPDCWTTVSAGASTFARTGTGLGDTEHLVGDFALKVTADAAFGHTAQQVILNTGVEFARYSRLLNAGASTWSGISPYITAGVWVKPTAANTFVAINDGVSTTFSAGSVPVDGLWHFISCRHLLTAASTGVFMWLVSPASATNYWSGAICMFGENQIYAWQPSPKTRRVLPFHHDGNAAVLTHKFGHVPPRPCMVEDTLLSIKTAPVGAALIVDVNHCTTHPGTFTTMYTTKPTIADGASYSANTVPDGTYRNRCFAGRSGAFSTALDRALSVDIDQVGSGTAGAELDIDITILQYDRPLESFLAS